MSEAAEGSSREAPELVPPGHDRDGHRPPSLLPLRGVQVPRGGVRLPEGGESRGAENCQGTQSLGKPYDITVLLPVWHGAKSRQQLMMSEG